MTDNQGVAEAERVTTPEEAVAAFTGLPWGRDEHDYFCETLIATKPELAVDTFEALSLGRRIFSQAFAIARSRRTLPDTVASELRNRGLDK